MYNNSNNTITIPKTEYNSLKKIETDFNLLIKEETCFYENTIKLFQEENLLLKQELHSLSNKYTTLEKSRNNILEKIQQDQKLILKSIQGVKNSLGVVTE